MSDKKHYYYLKLKEGFFDSDPMILLESMPDGYIYSNILLKLYLRSLKSNGKLMLNNRIPYSPQMIANVARVSVGVVEKSLKIFEELGLIEILDNGAMYMADIQSFIGESSTEADRKRVYRSKIQEEKKLTLGQTVGQMSDECPTNVQTNLHQSIEIRDIELNNKNISVNDFPVENLTVETAQGSELASEQVSNHSMTQDDVYFNTFWEAYPKRVAKIAAVKAFKKLKMTDGLLQEILKNIEYMKRTRGWKDGFLPNPASYLNGERWKDEVVHDKASGITEQSGGNEFTGIMSHITRV